MTERQKEVVQVYKILNTTDPISEENGKKLYEAINKVVTEEKMAIVNFEDILTFTTAVINNSIARFVIKDGIDEVSKSIPLSLSKNFFK